MKVRELIEILQREDPETEVNLMNGVGGYAPLRSVEVGWEPLYLPDYWDDVARVRIERQGPLNRVFCIVADW